MKRNFIIVFWKGREKMANESPRCCCSINIILTVIFIVKFRMFRL